MNNPGKFHPDPIWNRHCTAVVHLIGTGDADLIVLAGETNFATTLDLSWPTSGDRLFCGATVEWRDDPSRLRDDDDDLKRRKLFLKGVVAIRTTTRRTIRWVVISDQLLIQKSLTIHDGETHRDILF